MSNYTIQVTWSGKNALGSTDPEKIISGADYNTEFLAVQTAINSKMDITSGTTTGQTLVNPVFNTGITGNAVLDEDNMASNSATKIATQQSIKAYVDTTAAGTTQTLTNKSINLANNTITGTFAQFNSAVSNGTLVDLDDSQTLVNKTLTAPTINGVVSGTATSQTITTLTTNNVDGILGANTAATIAGTTGSFTGAVTASTTPSNANHLTNKTYVDNLFSGMASRSIVTAATTANVTISSALNNGDTLDGVTLATGDLVLVKDQSTASQNGIYVVGSSPARDDLFDTYDEHPGSLIVITEGTVNADTIYICSSNEGGSLDSTSIAWTKVTPAATSLNNLSDVTISSPSDGQAVVYSNSASKFVNSSVYKVGGTDVPVADGGTGVSSLTDGGILLGSGTGAITATAVLSDGQMIVGDGTTDPVLESGATLRTSIGLGTMAVVNTNAVPAQTLAGAVVGADQIVSAINLKDYGEVTNAIGNTGGGAQAIDLTLGNSVTATVNTSTNTFTFTNPTASDELCAFTLGLTNGASQTVNWPSTVDWAGGTAPTLTASGVDWLVFWTVDGGTIWNGALVGAAFA